MKKAIITPTFKGHFPNVLKFLDSAFENVTDPDNVTFFITVSDWEVSEFTSLTLKYSSKLDIRILSFDSLLEEFNVPYSNQELLDRYKKFSYQTLKKFYTMLHIKGYEQMLVLDSESMFIKETCINELFDSFFNSPFITICELDYLPNTGWFKQRVIDNVFLVLNKNERKSTEQEINKVNNVWLLENFIWFYDKNILNDMFSELGDPLSVVDYIYNHCPVENREQGCFEICLYQTYIYKNNQKYQYSIYKTKDILDGVFKSDTQLYYEYKKSYYELWKGEFGILEMVMCLLNKDNVDSLACTLKYYNFFILRCDFTNLYNYKYQKKFLDIVQPNILAASQGHIWGINNNIYSKIWNLLVFNNSFARFIYGDIKNIFRPFKPFYYWLRSFYYIGKHAYLWCNQLLTNLNAFKNK